MTWSFFQENFELLNYLLAFFRITSSPWIQRPLIETSKFGAERIAIIVVIVKTLLTKLYVICILVRISFLDNLISFRRILLWGRAHPSILKDILMRFFAELHLVYFFWNSLENNILEFLKTFLWKYFNFIWPWILTFVKIKIRVSHRVIKVRECKNNSHWDEIYREWYP